MAIIDLQRRLAEAGRIRIGQQVPTGSGKTRPAKLDTFRLTSADQLRIRQAAHLYGGDVEAWDAPAGRQWQVITATDALDVIVPPSDMSFTQSYELWSAGGCLRRCDGRTESLSEGACLCDPVARDCDIHTRLSVMLRDLPGLGVWRIDTQGYYAAVELQAAVEVIELAAGSGTMLPARLRLDRRSVKRKDEHGKPQTRRFVVPVLDIEVSPGQLMHGDRAVEHDREIVDGASAAEIVRAPGLTAVPPGLPTGPIPSVADQTSNIGAERRRSKSTPLPPTGIEPRTHKQPRDGVHSESESTRGGPPADKSGDVLGAPSPDGLAASAGGLERTPDGYPLITREQLVALHAAMREANLGERGIGLGFLSEQTGRDIASSKQLTTREASKCIDAAHALAGIVDRDTR